MPDSQTQPPILTIEQIQAMVETVINGAIAAHSAKTSIRFDKIESALSTGLDGKKGVIQTTQELQDKVSALEESDKGRKRTVAAAIGAVCVALGHTIWQLVTGGEG